MSDIKTAIQLELRCLEGNKCKLPMGYIEVDHVDKKVLLVQRITDPGMFIYEYVFYFDDVPNVETDVWLFVYRALEKIFKKEKS